MRPASSWGGTVLARRQRLSNFEISEVVFSQLVRGARNVASTTDPREVLELLHTFQPDLILLDLLMPHLDGFALMELLHSEAPVDSYLPILVLTADATSETRSRALAGGARDFLTKPLEVDEVLLRIANMLDTRFLYLQLQGEKGALEDRVQERTKDLESRTSRHSSAWPSPPTMSTSCVDTSWVDTSCVSVMRL
jgi:CheY-like chemotaxis protein